MWLFFILGHFLPYIPKNPKNENFKKWKKCPEISYSNWNTLCLQTHLFLHVMIRWVIQMICFDFANTRHVTAGKFSAKPHGTYRCHIWTQYGPYIRILVFLIYIYIYTIYIFHLHPHIIILPKLMINMLATLEIWRLTDIIIFNFGLFFALLPPLKNQNLKTKTKKTPRDIILHICNKN